MAGRTKSVSRLSARLRVVKFGNSLGKVRSVSWFSPRTSVVKLGKVEGKETWVRDHATIT